MQKNTSSQSAAVIGLWHLGCTVAASLASKNFKVTGFDFDQKLIGNLNRAQLPIAELGLSELTLKMTKLGRLNFSTDFKKLSDFKYIVIAYDTPVGDDDRPDLSVVNRAVSEIAKYARAGATVIVMSQVPGGTCRQIYLKLKKSVKGVEVVYNPENLRLSQAIETFLNADRQILGISSEKAEPRLRAFYGFYKNPLMFMSLESAELVKHGVNSFLAMSVSFINQLADLSESLGANIQDVVRGLKSDTRIGQKAFLSPGLGFAGGTLGRDLRVLESLGKKFGVALPLISNVYNINQNRKALLYKKINKVFPKLSGKKIALLGLVYKPGTNTLRRSLSLEVGKYLAAKGAEVRGFDPALSKPQDVLPVLLQQDVYIAAKGSDAMIIVTEWPEFKNLNYAKLKKLMRKPVIFDTKNLLSKTSLEKFGFKYLGTGV